MKLRTVWRRLGRLWPSARMRRRLWKALKRAPGAVQIAAEEGTGGVP
jgi:hypothetical protein